MNLGYGLIERKKRYTLEEVLAWKYPGFKIKKTYSEREVLRMKGMLGGTGLYAGALMIYDDCPTEVGHIIDRQLRRHNMSFSFRKGQRSKVVQLDDAKPLPTNYFFIAEKIIGEAYDEYLRREEQRSGNGNR